MRERVTSLLPSQFLRFGLCGGIAAAVNILARIAFTLFMNYSVAIVLSYLAGMATAYLLMKLLVFEQSGRAAHAESIRFVLINLVALVQVYVVTLALAYWLLPALGDSWHVETTAHVIGVLSPIVTSYAGHKYFTFRQVAAT